MTHNLFSENNHWGKHDNELKIIGCESACFIDEEMPEQSHCSKQLRVWDRPSREKIAFLKFDLNSLKGKKIRRAYLRLVNGSGHDWNATARLAVGKVLKPWSCKATWLTIDGEDKWAGPGAKSSTDCGDTEYEKTVFRVPEWQPGWFIDITQMVSEWIEGEEENHGIYVKGGIEEEPVNLKCHTSYTGLNPMLIVVCSDGIKGNGTLTKEQKFRTAFEALSQTYIARDISWSGSFVKNAQANADAMGWGYEYLKALKEYFDLCISDDGSFRNVSEEYFYVSSCGQALIHLYKATGMDKYHSALINLRNGLHSLPRSPEGIITAGGRVEVELIFCVCAFLAFYHDTFCDEVSRDLAVDQTIAIFDLMIAKQTDGIPLQNLRNPQSKGWSRGMGWIMAGMGKLISSHGVKAYRRYSELVERFKGLSEALSVYQKPNGLWRSIVQDNSKPEEVTGSALIALGYEYGYQQEVLDESYGLRVEKTLEGILKYTKTGIDMSNSFPMNFFEKYEVTDFSGNSDQGYGTWMELMTAVLGR